MDKKVNLLFFALHFNSNIKDISKSLFNKILSTLQKKFLIPTATEFTSHWLDHTRIKCTIHVGSGVIDYDHTDSCPIFIKFDPPNAVNFNNCVKHSLRPYSELFEENLKKN